MTDHRALSRAECERLWNKYVTDCNVAAAPDITLWKARHLRRRHGIKAAPKHKHVPAEVKVIRARKPGHRLRLTPSQRRRFEIFKLQCEIADEDERWNH